MHVTGRSTSTRDHYFDFVFVNHTPYLYLQNIFLDLGKTIGLKRIPVKAT